MKVAGYFKDKLVLEVNFFKIFFVQFVFLLLIVFGGFFLGDAIKYGIDWYFKPPIISELKSDKHFQHTDKKIVIYTAEWCPYCKALKRYLVERNIDFEDRDVDKGSETVKRLYKSLGQPSVPKIIIGSKVINGFDKLILDKEINLMLGDTAVQYE